MSVLRGEGLFTRGLRF